MPQGERRYLTILRGPEGEEVKYEFLDSVPGPRGRVLDRFRIENPASKKDKRGPFAQLSDLMATFPEIPLAFRIYMDLYNPGVLDKEPVPGYSFNSPKPDESK